MDALHGPAPAPVCIKGAGPWPVTAAGAGRDGGHSDSGEGTRMRDTVRRAVATDQAAVEEIVAQAYAPWAEEMGMRPKPMDADYAGLIAGGAVHVASDEQVDGVIVLVPEDATLLVENVAVRPAL